MFKYDQGRDRYVPDRKQEFSPYPTHFQSINHLSVDSLSDIDYYHYGSDNLELEPYEFERQHEQQKRSFYQLQSLISSEDNGGHLLYPLLVGNKHKEFSDQRHFTNSQDDMTWPTRMVQRRHFARKFNHISKTLDADQMLEMPNLSDDWMTKVLDWSSTGFLTAAVQSSIYLWSAEAQRIQHKINITDENESDDSITRTISCLKWDRKGLKLAYCFNVYHEINETDYHDTNTMDDDENLNTSEDDNNSTVIGDNQSMNQLNSSIRSNQSANVSMVEADLNYTLFSNMSDQTMLEEEFFNISPTAIPSLSDTTKNNCVIKVWLLSEEMDSIYEQSTSTCGCVYYNNNSFNTCTVNVMDWLSDGRVLVTGCTKATITFFRHDIQLKQLTAMSFITHKSIIQKLISCLQVSQDKSDGHLAVATYSQKMCTLNVWRLEKSTEYYNQYKNVQNNCQSLNINLIKVLVDCYNSKHNKNDKWVIKAFAWHPWKYSLMCYAVTLVSLDQDESCNSPVSPSWLVLANACRGQVLKRVQQTTSNFSPIIKILSVDTHAMSFSRLTGELIVSTSTAYRVRKYNNSDPSSVIVKRHSVVVMHSLNKIVETLKGSHTGKGLFFAWSSDGLRIAVTSTDESLRIWNFWPTASSLSKSYCPPSISISWVNLEDKDYKMNEKKKRKSYCNGNYHVMSELSFDASRIIK